MTTNEHLHNAHSANTRADAQTVNVQCSCTTCVPRLPSLPTPPTQPQEQEQLNSPSVQTSPSNARDHHDGRTAHPTEPETIITQQQAQHMRAELNRINRTPPLDSPEPAEPIDLRPAIHAAEPQYSIMGDWLVESVGEHTCGTGPGGYYGAHEPGCGYEPVARVEQLLAAEAEVVRLRADHLAAYQRAAENGRQLLAARAVNLALREAIEAARTKLRNVEYGYLSRIAENLLYDDLGAALAAATPQDEPQAVDRWDYDKHPGDCHPRPSKCMWTVCCRECAGTGVFPVPWIESPSEGRAQMESASCVACKGTGRAVVGFAATPHLETTQDVDR